MEGKTELIKESTSFDLVIPVSVERKIRILCREIPDLEWSGILFYTTEGSFDDGSLKIICEDILQMDEGTGTYTEFQTSPDIATYMVNHPELCNTYQGLIHSHAGFQTFFSGTDLNTLKVEGSDMAHFVSLIVNNEGTYTAAITRKILVTSHMKEIIPTWNGKKDTNEYEVTNVEIRYHFLGVTKEMPETPADDELLNRIEEIRKAKKKALANKVFSTPDNLYKIPVPKPVSLESRSPKAVDGKMDILVDSILRQLISGTPIINTKRMDLKAWSENIEKIYSRRFKDIQSFSNWADFYIDFLFNSYQCSDYGYGDSEDFHSDLAEELTDALIQLGNNDYFDAFIEILSTYIIDYGHN
jgi:hypothetical protein